MRTLMITAAALLLVTRLEWAGVQSFVPNPARQVAVVAHRGLAAGFPENTLAAFRHVMPQVDAIELDLRSTADGEIVVLHDETVDRTTDGRGQVTRMLLRDVRTLDAGRHAGARFTGERVPTYGDVLELARPGAVWLLLDIKQSDGASHQRIVTLTARHGMASRVIVGIRSVGDLRAFRALDPALPTLGFVPDVASIAAFAAAGTDVIRLWPEWIEGDPDLVTRVHALGTPVWVTAGTLPRQDLETLIRRGVDGILTDRPEVLGPLVADLGLRARAPADGGASGALHDAIHRRHTNATSR